MVGGSIPYEHYNYEALENTCRCKLCSNLAAARAAHGGIASEARGHKFRCSCAKCKAVKKSEREILVLSNRRDTYSELSFISSGRTWRNTFLNWAWGRVANPEWGDAYFWIHDAERKSLGSWLEDWIDEDDTVDRHMSCQKVLSIK